MSTFQISMAEGTIKKSDYPFSYALQAAYLPHVAGSCSACAECSRRMSVSDSLPCHLNVNGSEKMKCM